jgi:hypothetical protein
MGVTMAKIDLIFWNIRIQIEDTKKNSGELSDIALNTVLALIPEGKKIITESLNNEYIAPTREPSITDKDNNLYA